MDTIQYVLCDCSRSGDMVVLGHGTTRYAPEDWVIEHVADNKPFRRCQLPLEQGFAIGVSDYREPNLTGFGLWANRDKGFSWEWFVRERIGVFRTLQEEGVLRVVTRGQPVIEELETIVFETDVSLRFRSDEITRAMGVETHRVLIQAGSVLRLPP